MHFDRGASSGAAIAPKNERLSMTLDYLRSHSSFTEKLLQIHHITDEVHHQDHTQTGRAIRETACRLCLLRGYLSGNCDRIPRCEFNCPVFVRSLPKGQEAYNNRETRYRWAMKFIDFFNRNGNQNKFEREFTAFFAGDLTPCDGSPLPLLSEIITIRGTISVIAGEFGTFPTYREMKRYMPAYFIEEDSKFVLQTAHRQWVLKYFG